MSLPVDPSLHPLLDALEERHVAFLRERLVSDQGRSEWRENLGAALEHLLSTQVGRLVDEEAFARAIEAAMTPQSIAKTIEPAVTAAIRLASARLREETRPVGAFVPDDVRASVDRFLELPGLVPEPVLRAALEHEVTSNVLGEVLEEALGEFSRKVSPFTADWALPSLLGKLAPFGLGTLMKGLDGVRAEFERRLEPEIRSFLAAFSRRARVRVADLVVARESGREFVALRKHLAASLMAEPVASFVPRDEDARVALGRTIALELAKHLAAREDLRRERQAMIHLTLRAHTKQTLRAALNVYGVTLAPDLDALADATWPLVTTLLESDAVIAWMTRLTREFYASVR